MCLLPAPSVLTVVLAFILKTGCATGALNNACLRTVQQNDADNVTTKPLLVANACSRTH